MQFSFFVEGKPPKKDGETSVWSEKSKQSTLVFNLRSKALEAKKQAGFDDYFHEEIQLELKVFSPILHTKTITST